MDGFPTPLYGAVALLTYPLYILIMSLVLRVSGVERAEIARWALKQAERQRFTDLVAAARGLKPPDDKIVYSADNENPPSEEGGR